LAVADLKHTIENIFADMHLMNSKGNRKNRKNRKNPAEAGCMEA